MIPSPSLSRALALFLGLGGSWPATAQVLVSHAGSAGPTTESWSLVGSGGTAAPVTNDLALGIAAWSVNDPSSSAYYYSFVPTSPQISQAGSEGWRMKASFRITSTPPTGDSIGFGYENGLLAWNVYPTVNASNDLSVQFLGYAPSITLPGVGDLYHDYEIVFNPITATADLYVDDVLRVSNFSGLSYPLTQIWWGGGSSANTGAGNYSQVVFSIPEPAATAVAAGALAGLTMALRFRRSLAPSRPRPPLIGRAGAA